MLAAVCYIQTSWDNRAVITNIAVITETFVSNQALAMLGVSAVFDPMTCSLLGAVSVLPSYVALAESRLTSALQALSTVTCAAVRT